MSGRHQVQAWRDGQWVNVGRPTTWKRAVDVSKREGRAGVVSRIQQVEAVS